MTEIAVHRVPSKKRSIVKAVLYRSVIVLLDFLVVYLMTGKLVPAAAFMVVSNIYTTFAYFLNERLWVKINWGMETPKAN